jgi:hypothetical protein
LYYNYARSTAFIPKSSGRSNTRDMKHSEHWNKRLTGILHAWFEVITVVFWVVMQCSPTEIVICRRCFESATSYCACRLRVCYVTTSVYKRYFYGMFWSYKFIISYIFLRNCWTVCNNNWNNFNEVSEQLTRKGKTVKQLRTRI